MASRHSQSAISDGLIFATLELLIDDDDDDEEEEEDPSPPPRPLRPPPPLLLAEAAAVAAAVEVGKGERAARMGERWSGRERPPVEPPPDLPILGE
jgi:hypothetical protein